MDVSNAISFRPPRSKPGNPVMLVNDKVERFLLAVPSPRHQHGFTAATPANNLYSAYDFRAFTARKLIRKPKDFVTTLLESFQIRKADPLGSAGFRVCRIAPVEH